MSYFPDVIDDRMRRAFVRCPQKMRYEFIDHLFPTYELMDGLLERAMKSGIDNARKRLYLDGALIATSLKNGREHVQQRGIEFHLPIQEIHIALKSYDEYFKRYPLGTDGYNPASYNGRRIVSDKVLFPLPIRHPVSGQPLQYCTHIDMLSINQEDGAFFVIEDRFTTSDLDLGTDFSLDSEISAKLWVAREIYQLEFPFAEVRIIKPGSDYCAHRISTMRQKWMLTRWHHQLCADVRRMVDAYSKMEWGYNFDRECLGCPYTSLCLSEGQGNTSQFKQAVWLPQTKERKSL